MNDDIPEFPIDDLTNARQYLITSTKDGAVFRKYFKRLSFYDRYMLLKWWFRAMVMKM